jgi:bisphosphoglycerate-dependent phosphoglycerate mutase
MSAIFVRHGESTGNAGSPCHDLAKLELTEKGIQDCSRLHRRLSLLDGDQLSELGRDLSHRIFSGAQAASRGEHWADFAESVVCCAMHNGN